MCQGTVGIGAEVQESRTGDTSECSWKQDMHGTEGLASAHMCPYGLPVPYFEWTSLGQDSARVYGNKTQKRNRTRTEVDQVYLILELR